MKRYTGTLRIWNSEEPYAGDKCVFQEGIWCEYSDVKAELAKKDEEIARLRKIIIKYGLWERAPCCLCGYNGPNYYKTDVHKCSKEAEELAREALERKE